MNIDSLVYIPIHIAPGVYIRVVDEVYPDISHPDKYNALFFIASNYGPANTLVPITSEEQYLKTFGVAPIEYPWSSMMAQNHAKYATAYCIRLLPYDAKNANLTCAVTPLYIRDLKLNPNLIPTEHLHETIIEELNKPDGNNDLPIRLNQNYGEKYVFVLRFGYINQNTNPHTYVYKIGTHTITATIKNDFNNLPADNIYAIPIFSFSGLGEYYNRYAVSFDVTTENTFNLVVRIKTDLTSGTYSILGTYPNRSIFDQLDMYGTNIKLDSNNYYAGLYYKLDEINITNIKTSAENNKILLTNKFNGLTYDRVYIDLRNIDELKGGEIIKTIINNIDVNELKGGSDGSLKDQNGNFRYDVFASMVVDAVTGASRATGSPNSYLSEPIYDLLDEELFFKYIYDPTDHRFIDHNHPTNKYHRIHAVHTALHNFARTRYFNNSGAIVMANLAPINNPMDQNELNSKQIIRSELFTAYVSQFEGIYNGIYYDKWPHLLLIARDLIEYRAGKGMDDSFAGVIAANHAGVKRILRKYTLPERNVLTLRGLNYLVRDRRYGVYTDLGRTTYAVNSALRWLYVIEDIIDIKYELKMALKPFLHKLETYDWNTLMRRVENMVFKPRRARGLITEYNVKLVMDESYILQNILPIVITLKYARSMERISVTLYVR